MYTLDKRHLANSNLAIVLHFAALLQSCTVLLATFFSCCYIVQVMTHVQPPLVTVIMLLYVPLQFLNVKSITYIFSLIATSPKVDSGP